MLGVDDPLMFLGMAVEPPRPDAVEASLALLRRLGALDSTSTDALTPLGSAHAPRAHTHVPPITYQHHVPRRCRRPGLGGRGQDGAVGLLASAVVCIVCEKWGKWFRRDADCGDSNPGSPGYGVGGLGIKRLRGEGVSCVTPRTPLQISSCDAAGGRAGGQDAHLRRHLLVPRTGPPASSPPTLLNSSAPQSYVPACARGRRWGDGSFVRMESETGGRRLKGHGCSWRWDEQLRAAA